MKMKVASIPILASFYILNGTIYCSRAGIPHSALWLKVAAHAFRGLPHELLLEVKNAIYGCDRGRVTWTGKLVDGVPTGGGSYLLMGTPPCSKHEKQLKEYFSLTDLPKGKLKTDWKSDLHYKVVPADVNLLKEAARWVANEGSETKVVWL